MERIPVNSVDSMEEIRAVIFDMDGLMLNTERLSQIAWRAGGRDMGYELPDVVCHGIIGRVSADHQRIFDDHFGEGFPLDALSHRSQVHYFKLLQEELAVQPGLFELLARLESRGLPKAVATSTKREWAFKKLERTGIRERFDHAVTGDSVERGKPAPDIFLRAAELLETEPAHCLVLEDSYNGVRAGAAAGMRVIMIPDILPPTEEMNNLCWRVFDSLNDVAALF